MPETGNKKPYDLERRTLQFARDVRGFARRLPRTLANIEDVRQLVRSSGSIGANYIEANGSLGTKDFAMRLRICRKEAKETRYWPSLVDTRQDNSQEEERSRLVQESTELFHILGAILRKAQ